ncbi:MAG: ISKra4-like element ISDesp4 family transposase, partial [Acidimicrobiales bacterium]
METAIRAAMIQLGAGLLEGLLAADTGHRGQRIDCGAGHRAVFVEDRSKTIDTVLGPIGLSRAYYHCRECRHGVIPRDEQLEVTGESLSPGLRAMLDTAATTVPFAPAAGLLTELAGITLTTKRVERAAEADGLTAAAELATRTTAILTGQITPIPPATPAAGRGLDILYSAIDGTGIPMTAAETAGRAGKGPDGRAGTREAKLAAVFTQTRTDNDGYPVRDPASTSYIATLETVETFADLYQAEVRARGADHVRQHVILGDGARWIWNLATARFPEATQIVDLFHAREHLHELTDLLAFILPDRDTWLSDRLTELDDGDIDAIA